MNKTAAHALGFVCVLLLLVIANCSKAPVQPLPEEKEDTVMVTSEPSPAASCSDGIHNQDETETDCGGVCEQCKKSIDVTPQQLEALKTKHSPGEKLVLLYTRNAESARVGETVVFPVALHNLIVRPTTFKFGAKFLQARDLQNSIIPTKKELFTSWLDPQSFGLQYIIPERGTKYTFVSFTIGNSIDERNTKPIPGRYMYQLVAYYYDQPVWQEYAKQDIAVFVK